MMGLITQEKTDLYHCQRLSLREDAPIGNTKTISEKIFAISGCALFQSIDFYDSSQKHSERKDTEIKFKNLINGIYPQICSDNIKKVMRKQAEMGQYHGFNPNIRILLP